GGMRDRHGVDEMLLEAGLDRRLDLFDGARDPLDLVASLAREQRDERAGPGRVAGRADAVQRRIGHEPEHEGVQRIDLAPERAGELDPIDRLDAEVVHQESRSRVEGCLGELDRADVVLGDQETRRRRPALAVARSAPGPPSWRTYENLRPSGTSRGVRAPSRPSIVPSAVITPPRNSSAMTSTM